MAYKWQVLAGDVQGSYGNVDAANCLDARFNSPHDCALSPDRRYLYVTDYGNMAIRRITLSGTFPVETMTSTAPNRPLFINVNAATGNLWVGVNDVTNQVLRITPGGTVTSIHTDGAWVGSCFPDVDEARVVVKLSAGYYVPWQAFQVSDGAYLGTWWADGAYADWSGMMWSTRYPETYVVTRDYIYPSNTGAAIFCPDEVNWQQFTYSDDWFRTFKIVPGPERDGYETYVGLNRRDGRMVIQPFDVDPANLWMPTYPSYMDNLGLPPVPAVCLDRDTVTDTYYFPTIPAWGGYNSSVATAEGVPCNAIVVAVPADHLSAG